jgi:hypothetical protein
VVITRPSEIFLQLLNAKFAKVARSPLIVRVSFGSDLYLD